MIRKQGIVLLTTLVMILIMTQLVLSLMHGVLLFIKVSHQVAKQHDDFYQLESAGYSIIEKKFGTLKIACSSNEKNPNQIVMKLRQGKGCQFTYNERSYLYFLDDQGLYDCLAILVGKKLYASHHWLLTIMSIDSKQSVLQLRAAKIGDTAKCLKASAKSIHYGVLSWRYTQST